MKLFRTVMAAVALVAPLLAMAVPAQAITARQYHAQGHGRYITSKGRTYGYSHGRMRHRYRHHRIMRHAM